MGSSAQIIWRRHRRQERRASAAQRRRVWTTVFTIAMLVIVVAPVSFVLVNTVGFYLQTSQLLTQARQPSAAEDGRTTEIYDSTGGTLLYTLQSASPTEQSQNWVPLDTLPPPVINATLASEDINFLTNSRFDAADVTVKLWQNWLIATQPPDPSITGRLVRNVIAPAVDLQGERDLNTTRAREIALVAELERRYTPREILEWHLNTNYYGNEAYGIEAAAQFYLGKRAVDLSLDEAAMLAAIPTAPQYNPFSSEIAARGRQGDVLRAMFNTGMIDEPTYETASDRVTPIVRGNYLPPLAPEFTVYARRQAASILDSIGYDGTRLVALGGLRITTTLDLDLYQQISCVLEVYLAREAGTGTATVENCPAASFLTPSTPAQGLPPDTGALVILDAQTGVIRAMVGSAINAEHAPGVMLQPFVYLDSFLNSSQTPASMVFDIPNQYPGAQQGLIYTFSNPDQPFRGPMNLRDAMGSWRLPPVAEIAYREGMPEILQTAHQLGINSLDESRFDMMLLERGGAVSLLDMSYSMSVFSTLGDMRGVPLPPVARDYRGRDPVAIARIEDQSGNLLWEYNEAQARTCDTFEVCTPLLVPGAAYLVNDVLSDQETRWSVFGQNSAFDTSIPSAVIAGVAGDGERHWTVGYSPSFVVGTVLYRVDGQPAALDEDIVTTAAPVWHALIEYVHARSGVPALSWDRPDTVVENAVCDTSGLLPNGVCPVINEYFLDGTQPKEVDTRWQVVEINNQNGRLANFNTPPELRSEARFFVPPAGSAMEWWVANGQPLPPVEFDDVSRAQIFETVHIARPQAFDYVGGSVDVYADINPRGIQYIQLEYGAGFNPTQWLSIGGQQTEFDVSQPIGTWNTSALDGPYSLRLIAVMDDNTRESDALQVTVDNVMPTIRLSSTEPGKIYRWPTDEVVALQAEATDNLKIDRVEFYYEDVLLGADVSWPYGVDWQITGLGTHTFTATAFDGVGNQVSTQVTVEVLRSGS